METLHPYIDQNHQLMPIVATSILTEDNQHEVRCGMCAREIYVDEAGYRIYSDALISGAENQFRCEVCSDE